MYLSQRHFIYFPDDHLAKPALFEEVVLTTPDGLQLVAWYVPAKLKQPTMIYFHGNGGTIKMRENSAKPYLDCGMGVLLVEYRGYGGNPGKPNEVGLYNDGEAAYQFARQQGIPADHIILFGESLGSGIAVEIAKRYPVGGVILQAPFISAAAIGQKRYPYLPVGLLLKDRYQSIDKIQQINAPLAIVHGTADGVVPIEQGQALFLQANQPKQFFKYLGYGHSNFDPKTVANDVLVFFQQQPHLIEIKTCPINLN